MNAAVATDHPLEALERALDAERRALLENDVDALLASTADKLSALRRAESAQPGVIAAERLEALRLQNQANGVLLSRRRREVGWALRHIGRVESTGVYDSRGQPGARSQARCLGVG
ncbi:flagellar protein FlgN [Luteimonas viscosa]|uniref:Flagellar protein FlgN n=1 Tax=Luteimonas viscosa TaxID=1132694 RepID=A0A5D4XNN5_9GAMM|nr:flagellar protein FlgN [Luteimonas viscosa]TYT26288.1 flagellar protein FlgN [Luteimonas viscosa]